MYSIENVIYVLLENIFVYLLLCCVMLISYNFILCICRFVCLLLNIRIYFYLNIYGCVYVINFEGKLGMGKMGRDGDIFIIFYLIRGLIVMVKGLERLFFIRILNIEGFELFVDWIVI